ncbi:MAG TPA: hypothetical protein VFF77_05730, partial [Holophagaceae bacterium]|nr:hypothetical protein [Holophagaceae bacterium]
NSVLAPDGTRLTWPGGTWTANGGLLFLASPDRGNHAIQARTRPIEAELNGARKLQGARSRRGGWWKAKEKRLIVDLSHRRWLQVDNCTEAQAFAALDALEIHDAGK